ncbi:hypothetical protein [Phenylobacterium sp.]|uniref:hypothetical protein n=1 Tax=Phenylobacterium sp. TaxID=1871053 RepID=UPI00286ADABE|nr:hypothetical protein [Phenylobacterium sp.]
MIASALLAAIVVFGPPPRACPGQGAMIVKNAEPALLLRPQDRRGASGAQSLASLPPADLHQTVTRSVAGCALSTVVRENVQGDGRFAAPR